MGLHAIYQEPRTSQPHPYHRIYPYLLRNLAVTRANQVWCTDINILIKRGFLYLVAIMDWQSRNSPCLALVQYDGDAVLRGGVGGGSGSVWRPIYKDL